MVFLPTSSGARGGFHMLRAGVLAGTGVFLLDPYRGSRCSWVFWTLWHSLMHRMITGIHQSFQQHTPKYVTKTHIRDRGKHVGNSLLPQCRCRSTCDYPCLSSQNTSALSSDSQGHLTLTWKTTS